MQFRIGLLIFFISALGNPFGYSQISWNPKPVARFVLSPGGWVNCGFEVNFIDSSTILNPCNTSGDSCDSIIDWTWGFGDGASSKLKNPTNDYRQHVISESPCFVVKLKVQTKYGYRDSIYKNICLSEPEAVFKVVNDTIVEVGDSVIFENQSILGSYQKKRAQFEWNFGDGGILSDTLYKSNVGHRYASPGKYEVYLTASENFSGFGNNTWCADTYPDTILKEKKITITVNKVVNLSNYFQSKHKIFPNPAKDHIFIKGLAKGEIVIFDLTGKEILRKELNYQESLDISKLNIGTYLIKCFDGHLNSNSFLIKN